MPDPAPSKTARIMSGLALLAGGALGGTGLGALYVKLFVPRKAMGWDGLADMLGGLMVGLLAGLALALLLIFLATVRTQALAAAGLAVLGLVAWSGIVLTAPERQSEPVVERPKPFQPLVMIKARVSWSAERLAALPLEARPFSFTEIEVFSAIPHVVRTGWGGREDRCRATPSEEQLRALVPLLEAAAPEAGELCRTPDAGDPLIAISWNLGGERGGQSLEAGCFASDFPRLDRLAAAVDELAVVLCGAG